MNLWINCYQSVHQSENTVKSKLMYNKVQIHISIQNLNQIYYAVQELCTFSLKSSPAKMMLGEALSHFFIPVAGQYNVKIHKNTKFEPIYHSV